MAANNQFVPQQNMEVEYKATKCRTFYHTKYCQHGSMCMFRHEIKKFQQLLRHYYVVKLYCLESLYQYSVDRNSFVNEFETGVRKLPVFEQIHNAHSETSNLDKKSKNSVESDLMEESSTRSLFKELAQELKKTFTKNDTSESSSRYYR